MEVIKKNTKIEFKDLKPGDCFYDEDGDSLEMKIDSTPDAVALRAGCALDKVNEGDGLSVRLKDGAVWYYNADDLVTKVAAHVEED